MKTAFSYIRFSTPEQAKGDSLRRQLERTRSFCAQHNLQLVEEMTDLGVSAFRGKNLEDDAKLGSFLKLVRDGKIQKGSVLVVESFDRISRDKVLRCQTILQSILLNGIGIAPLSFGGQILTEESVNENPMLLVMAIVEQIRGGNESQVKSERVRSTIERNLSQVRKGERVYFGGWMPSYVRGLKNGEWIIDEPKMKLIQRIFNEFLAGKSMSGIACQLNRENVGGIKRKKIGMWHQVSVKNILSNPAVTGTFTVRGEAFKNYLPVVVSPSDFDRVQRKIAQNVNRRGGSIQIHNLFSGIMFCSECGGPVGIQTSEHKGKQYNYLCCTHARFQKCGVRGFIPRDNLEMDVFNFVINSNPYKLTGNGNEARRAEIEKLESELTETEKQLNKVVAVMEEVDDVEALTLKLKTLKNKRQSIKDEIAKITGQMTNIQTTQEALNTVILHGKKLTDLMAALKDIDLRQKLQNLMPSLIGKIVVNIPKKTYTAYNHSGETLVENYNLDF